MFSGRNSFAHIAAERVDKSTILIYHPIVQLGMFGHTEWVNCWQVVDQKGLFAAGGDLPPPVLAFSKGDIEKPSNSLSPPPERESDRKLRGGNHTCCQSVRNHMVHPRELVLGRNCCMLIWSLIEAHASLIVTLLASTSWGVMMHAACALLSGCLHLCV